MEFLDFYDKDIENLYDFIYQYFGDPILTKTSNNSNSSIYVAKNKNCISINKRYIFAISYLDNNPIGHKINLSDIKWKSFQCRTLQADFNMSISSFEYIPSNNYPSLMTCSIIHKNENFYEYKCDDIDNVYMYLIKEDWEKEINKMYRNKGNIINFIETWKSEIRINK